MKVPVVAAAVFLALTGAAWAQANTIIDPEMLPENRAIDQQYRNALKRLPDPAASHDPWGTVRSVEQENSTKQAAGKKTRAN